MSGQTSREKHGSKGYMYLIVNYRAIYNSPDMEATQMSTDRWVDKEEVVHIYTSHWYIPATEKKERMPFPATWMDLEIIILSEVK